ncbi:methyltransferase [Dulcicalothrix desertica PCC 7102]|uniref:Methyltransferase n=1 Tax=Dulcicalothrix desertica PCC 7102 TaxID=232991 RepID=A0A3S1AJZ8_9CYAN|nr:class I SAM-dependent methyltransferase [Dulcicalothrix desertica]RUT02439.1 methyltransferase [Dulcicalothrix desertica PCC 7102]TWH55343.1 Methylase involved in ubiquinone/menaquinone biosynthesis [Dulcicalothrix desertica PCC 7102]
MGFYSQRILPYLLDWSLSSPIIGKYRQEVLAGIQGEVLEIGFGTGLNLSYYPDDIYKIVTVDPNPGVHALAKKRIESSSITVEHKILSGENLPMADNSFKHVVSTFTLCSIANVEQALGEVYRVLKPGGAFHFLEHGLSKEPEVQVWQNRLTPLQKIIADGCHFNRNIRQLVENQFQNVKLEEFYLEDTPKVSGYLYKGVGYKLI